MLCWPRAGCAACARRVTGRGHLDINRISGYLPGKLVSFLMQVMCLHNGAAAVLQAMLRACRLAAG